MADPLQSVNLAVNFGNLQPPNLQRRTMSATLTDKYPNYSPGLEGVIAGISTISEIDSDRSSLQYRGYDVHDLAEHGSFEETAYLLIYGKLPNQAELDEFRKT